MLILTRRPGEMLVIDHDIQITICHLNLSYVRLGIIAPAKIEIYRHEIYQKMLKEKEALNVRKNSD